MTGLPAGLKRYFELISNLYLTSINDEGEKGQMVSEWIILTLLTRRASSLEIGRDSDYDRFWSFDKT